MAGETETRTCPECDSELSEVTSRHDRVPRFQCPECGLEETVPLGHEPLYVTTVEDRQNGIERYLCQACPATWTKPRGEPAGACPNAGREREHGD